MSKNEIIEALFLSKNFRDCIGKMEPEHLRDDLKQEVILIVCQLPEEKIKKLHQDKALEFYTVKIILNLIKNSASLFSKQYRMPMIQFNNQEIADTHDTEEREIREAIEDIAIEEINRLYWYDAELVRLYMQLGNFRAIEEQTGIPFISCYKNIQKSIAILKTKALGENKPVFTKSETRSICQDTR